MADIPSGTHVLSGADSQKLRTFCSSQTWTEKDLDGYAKILQRGSVQSVCDDFNMRKEEKGIEAARKELADLNYGPTKVPLFNFLLQLRLLDPASQSQYLEIVSYLALEVKVPVDSTDLSGNTALMYSICTKPYFDTEFADVMLAAGGDINHRNRYGCVAAHDVVMVRDLSASGKRTAVDALSYFIKHGGSISVADGDGITPIQIGSSVARFIPELGVLLGGSQALPSGGGSGTVPKAIGRKIGRNDPCWCGSKKKYKVCCGKV